MRRCAATLFPRRLTETTRKSIRNNRQKTAETLRRQVQEEIKTLGNHPWAGDYYCGDGLGANISLILHRKPATCSSGTDLGLYDRNYGPVAWTKGRLRLSFSVPNQRQGFQGIAEEFIPVTWGERQYLVPANDMVQFCNEVNSGDEPQEGIHGCYLLRRGDEEKDAQGFPAVPEAFKRFLLRHPIQAEIVDVGKVTLRSDSKFKETPVTLNRGKKQGLLAGMALQVVKPDNLVEAITVTKVEEERSEAVMTQISEEAGPQVGWTFSTRRH